MRKYLEFYIDGKWVAPSSSATTDVVNPATEQVVGQESMGTPEDIDRAVKAARRAFKSSSATTREARIDLISAILAEYKKRTPDLGEAIMEEMGSPAKLAEHMHARVGAIHLKTAQRVLKDYLFFDDRAGTKIAREPIGVCGLITPWNWPINQIATKVAPALACGCTMVLKPSELSPFSAYIWTEIFDKAGVPAGVFNLVNGDGLTAGAALSAHPDVDMVSFTGSTRAGIDVARNAAMTIKRVHQELGGKSANIVLPDADLESAVKRGVHGVMRNSGQSCNAPTRMLVPRNMVKDAIEIARATAESLSVGDPRDNPDLGPVASIAQFNKVQDLIRKGIDEGAMLVTGGLGRPSELPRGYFVKPTIFSDVNNEMAIAREEIFGPVLVVIPYDTVEQAIDIANDTVYGLAAYIQGKDQALIKATATKLRVGQVIVNEAGPDPNAPFGGYKQSGNGREWGEHAFAEFLEVKALLGLEPAAA